MASYYVDATLGDDSNPGTQSQPWKTISKVNSSSFSPGDKIYFKRGEVWREQLTVPSSGSDGNPITFGAYGSGDKPIISALEEVPSGDWSGPDENGEYTYSTTTTCVVFAEDGEFIPEGVSGNLSPGEWDYDSDTNTLYYKPSSGTPSDHTTERGERIRAVLINGKSYITLENLSLVGNNHPNAYKNCIDVAGTGSNIIIDNCLVKIAYVCGIEFGPDISNSRISNTEVTQCTNRGIWVRGSNSVVRNCHVHHIGQGNLIDSHDREGISVGGSGNIVESCIVHDCGHPSAGDDQSGWGILLYGGTGNNTVRYNTVYNIDHIGIGVFQSDDKVYYNVIYNCGIKATADGGYFGGIRVKGNLSGIEIYNNVVYKCRDNISTANKHYGAGILVFAAANNTLSLTLKNNIVAFNETNYDLVVQEMDATAEINLTSDYNCFYRLDGAKFFYNDSEKTFSEYQSASGQDSHSKCLDPSFVDPANRDFHLKPISPCIDAGVDVGLNEDFDGTPVPWGEGVDIGAYERETGYYPLKDTSTDQYWRLRVVKGRLCWSETRETESQSNPIIKDTDGTVWELSIDNGRLVLTDTTLQPETEFYLHDDTGGIWRVIAEHGVIGIESVTLELPVEPQEAIEETEEPWQKILEGSGYEERRIELGDMRSYVELRWPLLTERQGRELFDFFLRVRKYRSFKWTNPKNNQTYVVRFDSDLKRTIQASKVHSIDPVKLKILDS